MSGYQVGGCAPVQGVAACLRVSASLRLFGCAAAASWGASALRPSAGFSGSGALSLWGSRARVLQPHTRRRRTSSVAAAPHSARYLRLPVGACAVRRAPVKGQPPGGLLCGHRPRLRLNGYKTRILYNFAVRSAAPTKITRRRAPKSAFCTISLSRSRPPGKPAGGFRPLFWGACVCHRRFGCAVHAGFVFASARRFAAAALLSQPRPPPPSRKPPPPAGAVFSSDNRNRA